MSVRAGLGFGAFPFDSAASFWRWIDQCEDSIVDSIWLSERLVSPQPFLEPLTALAAKATSLPNRLLGGFPIGW